jgi:hypothetical protein
MVSQSTIYGKEKHSHGVVHPSWPPQPSIFLPPTLWVEEGKGPISKNLMSISPLFFLFYLVPTPLNPSMETTIPLVMVVNDSLVDLVKDEFLFNVYYPI